MKKTLPFFLLLCGLFLLLYPSVCRQISAADQRQAIQTFLAGETEIEGYLHIPALQLTLPIRQGTGDTALRAGVGLLEGTAFDSHAVLCGHRGLPESRLFQDLDQLRTGDSFTVTTDSGSVTYLVDQIRVVSPEDTTCLLPEKGLRLCTLMTCTPYGINSHRLLVRGRYIDPIF